MDQEAAGGEKTEQMMNVIMIVNIHDVCVMGLRPRLLTSE